MMNKILFGHLLCLFFCVGSSAAEDKIKIGVSSALTGANAALGTDIVNAIQFANEELARGKYNLVIEDDACNGKLAVNIAHKFTEIDKVNYVLGFLCSGTLLSSASVYEHAKVVAIGAGTAAASVTQAGDYIFRTWVNDAGVTKNMYFYMATHYKKLGVLSEQTDFCQSLYKSLSESNAGGSLQIINEDYLTSETDFRLTLLKLKASNIDALFINANAESKFLEILRRLHEMKWKVQVYATYFPGNSEFFERAGDIANGIVFVDMPYMKDVATVDGKDVLSKFVSKYGRINSRDSIVTASFESFRALHQAIQSGDDVRHYLYTTKFHGVFGDWWFDSNGDIQGIDYVLKTIKNGKVEILGQ